MVAGCGGGGEEVKQPKTMADLRTGEYRLVSRGNSSDGFYCELLSLLTVREHDTDPGVTTASRVELRGRNAEDIKDLLLELLKACNKPMKHYRPASFED
jgi:hypothetical protein